MSNRSRAQTYREVAKRLRQQFEQIPTEGRADMEAMAQAYERLAINAETVDD